MGECCWVLVVDGCSGGAGRVVDWEGGAGWVGVGGGGGGWCGGGGSEWWVVVPWWWCKHKMC